jgi:MFS family permease
MPTAADGERIRQRALRAVFIAVVIDWMGVSLTQAIMPFYITEVLHGPPWSVGCLYAVFASVQIVGTPLLGWASDVYGRRPVLLISLAGTSSGYALSAIAPDFRWLLAARGLQGFFSSSLSVANAYIADTFPGEDRPRLMAQLRGLGNATYFICPAIGSLLALLSLRAPYIAGASTSAVAFAVALVWMPPVAAAEIAPLKAAATSAAPTSSAHAVHWRKILVLGLINMLLSFAVAAAMFVVALYLQARLVAPSRVEQGLSRSLAIDGRQNTHALLTSARPASVLPPCCLRRAGRRRRSQPYSLGPMSSASDSSLAASTTCRSASACFASVVRRPPPRVRGAWRPETLPA